MNKLLSINNYAKVSIKVMSDQESIYQAFYVYQTHADDVEYIK